MALQVAPSAFSQVPGLVQAFSIPLPHFRSLVQVVPMVHRLLSSQAAPVLGGYSHAPVMALQVAPSACSQKPGVVHLGVPAQTRPPLPPHLSPVVHAFWSLQNAPGVAL